MHIEARLAELGLTLPPPLTVAPGVKLPFDSVRVLGDRAVVSGRGGRRGVTPPGGRRVDRRRG